MGEQAQQAHLGRSGAYYTWSPRAPDSCAAQCYNYPSGTVSVYIPNDPIDLGFGRSRTPNIQYPLGVAYDMSGRLASAASSETGDGSLGLDPTGASSFASAFVGRRAHIDKAGQLYLNVADKRLTLGNFDNSGLKWFALDTSSARQRWAVSARAATGSADGQTPGLIYFATGWSNIFMAKSDVAAYFAHWSDGVFGLSKQDPKKGTWYVACDADTGNFERLVIDIQGQQFSVAPKSLIGDYRGNYGLGQRWCLSKLQITANQALQMGITTVLGYVLHLS